MTINLPAFEPTLEELQVIVPMAMAFIALLITARRLVTTGKAWHEKGKDGDEFNVGAGFAAVGAIVCFNVLIVFTIAAFWPDG